MELKENVTIGELIEYTEYLRKTANEMAYKSEVRENTSSYFHIENLLSGVISKLLEIKERV